MKAKDKFEEAKMKMIMKLKKLHFDTASEKAPAANVSVVNTEIGRGDDVEFMTAEEFFGKV